ncbi:MAG: GTPase Era [Myxococcales bacterium]|nr:GTPase Era [Myxococcales bacterium]
MSQDPARHRCGVVALLGRPNAGKSTLLNALLGEKIAITSPRAQTTRSRILGVVHRPGAQLLFHDTPGVNRSQARFNLALTEAAIRSAEDADVRVLLFDAGAAWDTPEERLASLSAPLIAVRTKCDLRAPGPLPSRERFDSVLEISARTGAGIEALIEVLIEHLPESPALYPEDALTDRSLRFLACELLREVSFELLRDEIPYSLGAEVLEWNEADADLRIRANLLVERDSQKGIVVGDGGRMLRELGTEARRRIAELVGKPVHLKLWVKTDRNWTRRLKRARELGYL